MKAISINQPWAWLIVRGFKDIENRDWPTRFRGEVLVHTGMNKDPDFDYERWEKLIGGEIPRDLFQGGIIGRTEIVDCVDESPSPWFFGKYGFVLRNSVFFAFPQVCKGALGFFEPDYNSRYKPKPEKAPKVIKPAAQGSLL